MSAEQSGHASSPISQRQLLAFAGALISGSSGREGDDNPLPAGPWDPVIRGALEELRGIGALSRRAGFGDEVALNPQPLPPRYAVLAAVVRTVIRRVDLFQEIADATVSRDLPQGIIIVGGYLSRFIDEWCGTGYKPKWPFPGPRPHWFDQELDGYDLIVMAAQFDQSARATSHAELKKSLREAAGRFAAAGVARMPQSTGGQG